MEYEKIYLILGASSDVGLELIQQLSDIESNSLFICHYRTSADEINKIVPGRNNKIESVQADLSHAEDVEKLIEKIQKECGCPSHIVHLPAGTFQYTKLKKFEWEQFQQELEIQVHSLIKILQVFLPQMAKKEVVGKVVIMLTSYTLSNPPKFMMSYIMAKYTLLGLMKSLAADYAGKNVCINAISPSMIETKFLKNIDDRIIQLNAQNSISSKNASVKDIVPGIRFLLSKESDFVHGINLNISNGNVI